MNGVIKTRLATLETVVEIFKADCHKIILMPISKKPIYIDPMSPSIDGTTKESVRYMIKKIMGELNKKIRNKPTKEIKTKLIIEPTKYNSDLKSNMAYRSLSVII